MFSQLKNMSKQSNADDVNMNELSKGNGSQAGIYRCLLLYTHFEPCELCAQALIDLEGNKGMRYVLVEYGKDFGDKERKGIASKKSVASTYNYIKSRML